MPRSFLLVSPRWVRASNKLEGIPWIFFFRMCSACTLSWPFASKPHFPTRQIYTKHFYLKKLKDINLYEMKKCIPNTLPLCAAFILRRGKVTAPFEGPAMKKARPSCTDGLEIFIENRKQEPQKTRQRQYEHLKNRGARQALGCSFPSKMLKKMYSTNSHDQSIWLNHNNAQT